MNCTEIPIEFINILYCHYCPETRDWSFIQSQFRKIKIEFQIIKLLFNKFKELFLNFQLQSIEDSNTCMWKF